MRLEARFPYHDSRTMTHSSRPAHGDLTSLAPHERLPEIPVVPREKPHSDPTARENPQDAPVIAKRGPSVPAWPGKQSRVLSPTSTGGLTPFRPLSGIQEIPIVTLEETGFLCFPSRRGLSPRVSLECNPKIRVAPGEEH